MMDDAPGLLPLYNLLARASNVSCSKGANAFLSLLTTEDDRFSLAINGFIPVIENPDLQIPQRILAAYVLDALYSQKNLNPFRDHLLHIFESARALALAELRVRPSFTSQHTLASLQDGSGMHVGNEQLVWVLWKILQGESDELAPYSPIMLSCATIPEHFHPIRLVVHDGSRTGNGTHFSSRASSTENLHPPLGVIGTSQTSKTLFQTGNPSSVPQSSHKPSESHLVLNTTPSVSDFSPFGTSFSVPQPSESLFGSNRASSVSEPSPVDTSSPGSISQKNSVGKEVQGKGWLQQAVSPESFTVDGRTSRVEIASFGYEPTQETAKWINNTMASALGVPVVQPKPARTSTRVSHLTRSPGVIGSGRPSASGSKIDATVDRNHTNGSWFPEIGIIGNGRPDSATAIRERSQLNRGTNARKDHESMIPFSVLRMRSVKEESERRDPGVIGQSKVCLKNDKGMQGIQQTDGQTSLLGELTALNIGRTPQELSQNNMAPFEPKPQVSDGKRPSKQDPIKFVSTHAYSETQAMPSSMTSHPQSPGTSVFAAEHGIKNGSPIVSSRQPASPSSSALEHGQPSQIAVKVFSPQLSPLGKEETSENINGKERDELSQAIVLLLSARERVLTLTEQRMLQPHFSMLTHPLSLLRPGDIPPLVAKNTDIAAKLLVLLLDRNDEDAARTEQILRDASVNGLSPMKNGSLDGASSSPLSAAPIDSGAAVDGIQAMVKFISTCGGPSDSAGLNDVSPFGGREAKEGYLDALRKLPPTMQSFNLIARLLRPTHQGGGATSVQKDLPEVRVATLIRAEVLGGFVSGCVRWIEHAEQEEKEGEVHDDRVAVAISSLCRFYSSLLKHGFVSAASDADTIEIMSFALQFSRFEEARSLYSILAASRS